MKFIQPVVATSSTRTNPAVDGGTREAVARSILEDGPQCAAELADRLGLSPAGVRRHLEALVADGVLQTCEPRRLGPLQPGRGRPARAYQLTDAGRAAFPHAYDDLASTALRYLREVAGAGAVERFAEHRAHTLFDEAVARIDTAKDEAPVQTLARALSEKGYAATVQGTPVGAQICQHHCPVAHVAAEFPQLCEAETRVLEELLGTNVQRLATIAHGDGVCTTHIPDRHIPDQNLRAFPTIAGSTSHRSA